MFEAFFSTSSYTYKLVTICTRRCNRFDTILEPNRYAIVNGDKKFYLAESVAGRCFARTKKKAIEGAELLVDKYLKYSGL